MTSSRRWLPPGYYGYLIHTMERQQSRFLGQDPSMSHIFNSLSGSLIAAVN
jgi:hypothetical protein